MVKVSAVIISTPDRFFKVIIACCIDQRGRLSISLWLKTFFVVRCRIQFIDEFLWTESEGDSLDRLPYAVLAKWSFLRLKFLQIPLLTIFSITKLRSLASKTKVRGRPFNSWGGGGGVGDFWLASFFFLATWWAGYFFPSYMLCRIFFSLLVSLQDFFFLKKVSCLHLQNVLHLHCGYCSNSSNMELQSLIML